MNTKLIDTYPNPMDGYHPKNQHMCTHFEALAHWNVLTLSLWEVAWTNYAKSTMSIFLHIGLSYTYWIQTKSPRQEHCDAHFGSNERWQLRRIALAK